MKQMPPADLQRSTYHKQPARTKYRKKFGKAFAYAVFALLIIMLPGGRVQIGQEQR